MRNEETQKIINWLISLTFVVLVVLPVIGLFFSWDYYPEQDENRKLASFPEIKKCKLEDLPDKLTAYCDDHFGFRNTYIHQYQKIQKQVFNKGTSKVLKGTEPGWYFYKKGKAIADFMGNDQFTDEELKIWGNALQERHDFFTKKNIPYVFCVCPDKPMVYPEYLPEETCKYRGQTRFEQLQAYTGFDFVYPLEELLENKESHLLYFPKDTHWNLYGGYIGYLQIIKKLQEYMPEIHPISLDDCTIRHRQMKGDVATMYRSKPTMIDVPLSTPPKKFNITTEAFEKYDTPEWQKKLIHPPPQIKTNSQGGKKLLLIHDSFAGHGPADLLPTHFGTTYLFWMYAEMPDLKQLVEELKPDVVIEMRVERSLRFIPGWEREAE